jgi:putative ABC transport system permease protein
MAIGPILAQLRRNKTGAVLIAVQMAITLAILTNAVFIIHQRVVLTQRPSGTDEQSIFVMHNEWLRPAADGLARLQSDLAILRKLPGVIDAYASNSYPMMNSGSTAIANLTANQAHPTALAAAYVADDHALRTLGLHLIAGQNFTPAQLGTMVMGELPDTSIPGVIITRVLAEKLFPRGNAAGRTIYLDASRMSAIVGVVEKLPVPWTSGDGWGSTFWESSMLLPLRPEGRNAEYIVRVQPGQLPAVMAAAPEALYALDRARIVSRLRALSDVRREAYRDDRGFAIVLGTVCVVMLAITACGIVGLTSYWVAQRRRQIGIRRALGGTRSAIVSHFQSENLMIALAGILAGAAGGVGLNLWAVQQVEMARMPGAYIIIGAMALIALGQLAALWPALRAAWVPPAIAARSL